MTLLVLLVTALAGFGFGCLAAELFTIRRRNQ